MQRLKPFALFYAGIVDGVAGALVVHPPLSRLIRAADELHLVDHDARRQLVRFGDDEKAIEHARMRLGVRRRENDDPLIDVCRNDALAVSAAGIAARKMRASRKDLGDRPRTILALLLEHHAITNGKLERFGRGGDRVAPQRAIGALAGVALLHPSAK